MLFKVKTAATLVEGTVERMRVKRLDEAPGVLAGDVLLHHLGAADVGGQSGNVRAVFLCAFPEVYYTLLLLLLSRFIRVRLCATP